MAELLRAAQARESALLRQLRALVEIESPSDDKAAVDRAGDWAAAQCTTLGGTVKRHRQRAFGDVLELRFGRTTKATTRTLLLGHLDTVWPMGTLRTMPWRETGKGSDAKIFGPGVLDMKAGVVMALEALRLCREHGPLPPVTLLLNSEEEIGSPVSRAITERLAKQCAAVYVLEPAQGLAYKTARKGVGHFELRVTGIAAHSGVDFERGRSAIREMARLIETVSAWTDLARGFTVNVGVVRGGTRSNVIAADCTAEIDVRIRNARDAAHVAKLFRSLRVTDKGCTLTVTGGINRPPMERKPGTVALFRRAQKLAAEIGLQLDEAATGGGSDGNFTAALGVPTLDGMGAVGAGAHAAHEHILRAHLAERTALLAGMLLGARDSRD
jgi:glutamate carboxypeptidase